MNIFWRQGSGQHPVNSPALHFNHFEYPALYFNAVAADGDNPDYLFNLAVSLEQLRQPQEAARHYRLALAAAHQRAGAFAGTLVEARLQQLAAARQP